MCGSLGESWAGSTPSPGRRFSLLVSAVSGQRRWWGGNTSVEVFPL